eukprot:826370-Pleurochrysis_carterae.AAC.2
MSGRNSTACLGCSGTLLEAVVIAEVGAAAGEMEGVMVARAAAWVSKAVKAVEASMLKRKR